MGSEADSGVRCSRVRFVVGFEAGSEVDQSQVRPVVDSEEDPGVESVGDPSVR